MAFVTLAATPAGHPDFRAARERVLSRVATRLATGASPVWDRYGNSPDRATEETAAPDLSPLSVLCAETALVLDLGMSDAAALATCCELLQMSAHRRARGERPATPGNRVLADEAGALAAAGVAALEGVSLPGAGDKLVRAARSAVLATIGAAEGGPAAPSHPPRTVVDYLDRVRAATGPLAALALELPLVANGFAGSLPRARQATAAYALARRIADDVRKAEADRAGAGPSAFDNVVLLLERLGAKRPIADAASLARGHLAVCRAAAAALPAGSGTPLVEAAWALDAAIGESGHD